LPWRPRPGYAVEEFATDFQLPVNIAMVPDPGPHASDPLLYVTELYGLVKVVSRDGTVRDYTPESLLNFNPTGNFPGSGEMGLTGIVVEPASGDLFVSLVYDEGGHHYPKVMRLESDERGLSEVGRTDVLVMAGATQGASHQISNLTISPSGDLFVHNGDGLGSPERAQNKESFVGKILRMTLDGEPLADNPFYDDSDSEFTAEDYIYAWGSGTRLAAPGGSPTGPTTRSRTGPTTTASLVSSKTTITGLASRT
jgi:glucose/arabinose dehydrogenase